MYAFCEFNISQLEKPMEYSGVTYPKGTWIIPMDQEFAEMARQVLDVQVCRASMEIGGFEDI